MLAVLTAAAALAPPITLTRERNGWCIRSAQLWLALEVKAIDFTTVRGLAPAELPQLTLPDGSSHTDVLDAIRALDAVTPPLWPPEGVDAAAVDAAVSAYNEFVPTARESARAPHLFCAASGFEYDPLPLEEFEAALTRAENALGDGPFFAGAAFSAADCVWAPLLERYAAQLPCIYDGLEPRRSPRWPKLGAWYDAMDSVPAYACRVKGDAPSWRKVLSTSPWWPAGWPPRGGPDERGDPRGGALVLTEAEAVAAYGDGAVSDELWAEYARERPHVAPSAAAEAAAALERNAAAIVRDAEKQLALPPGTRTREYEAALRAVTAALLDDAAVDEARQTPFTAAFLDHLDERVCVPRDLGAPPAAAIRALRRRLCGVPEEASTPPARRAAAPRRTMF